MENNNNKSKHEQLKAKLKIIGFLLLSVGGIIFIIFLVDFFSVFNSWRMPQYPFLGFIGIPMLAAGGACLSYAYMGKVAHYTSKEITPVVKDSANYILDNTKESIAGVIKEAKKERGVKCKYCGEENDKNANYCDNCGKQLIKKCRSCGEKNDSNAKYCDNCGKSLL